MQPDVIQDFIFGGSCASLSGRTFFSQNTHKQWWEIRGIVNRYHEQDPLVNKGLPYPAVPAFILLTLWRSLFFFDCYCGSGGGRPTLLTPGASEDPRCLCWGPGRRTAGGWRADGGRTAAAGGRRAPCAEAPFIIELGSSTLSTTSVY